MLRGMTVGENFTPEEIPQIIRNGARKIGSLIVHREENALNLQRVREAIL